MNPDHRALLAEELGLLKRAEEALRYSYERCVEVGQKDQYTPEELERFESLTSRFSRMSDLLLQRVFRLIDRIDLEDQGTVRDRINRAEKKGLVASAEQFILVRELRNRIAHQYVPEGIQSLFAEVLKDIPVLFETAWRVHKYCERYASSK